MPRMSKKRKLELSFFLNDRGRVTYNELCRKCQHECRQSFRAVVIDCPRYLSNVLYDEDNLSIVDIDKVTSLSSVIHQNTTMYVPIIAGIQNPVPCTISVM